jgi:two-component system chemotaxis sensor kinase CheA
MVDVNSPIVKEFLIESFESLSNISEELTQFEKNSSDNDLLNAIYRKVHTLKGSASFLGLKVLQNVTHLAENILDEVREGETEIDGDIVDVLLESFDACMTILKSIESSGTEGTDEFKDLLAKLERVEATHHAEQSESLGINIGSISKTEVISQGGSQESAPSEDIKVEEQVQPVVEEVIEVVEEIEVQNKVASQPDSDGILKLREKAEELKTKIKEEKLAKKAPATESVAKKTSATNLVDSVVRVNVSLLDKIMNVVGELVLNRNQILQYANNDTSSELSRLAHQLNAITTELQTDIMTTRMQPVGSVLSKFERVVRDLSRQQGKNIKLSITGKETELDKTLLEAIRDPLTHLIRNSVDHGVEVPERRVSNGKPEQGSISIRAYHEGGQVTIEIADDGNGIDPEKILAKAISKEIITAERGKSLSKKQILNLVFTPGFSTAEQVTNISGRGVGMDVVKSNIEKIGGSVDVSSKVGEGTVFKLKIPLTLAIVPALVVQSCNETYAIPQTNLVELVRIEEDDEKGIENIHDSEFYRLRGDLIPIFRLDSSLNLVECSSEDKTKDINIAILNAEGAIYGLVVDQVLDTEEIVVKPLSRELKELSIYGGATIMGDGSVALIIDALGYYNHMGRVQAQKKTEVDLSSRYNEKEVAYNDEVLLCSLEDGREYGIPLAIVHRLEEFNIADVEWSGDMPLIRYRGKAMPLIQLESNLGISDESALSKKQEELPVIVIRARGVQLGFVVSEIRDIAINQSKISTDTSDRDGFVGTAFINERTITVLDIYKIVDSLPFAKNVEEASSKGKVLVVEDSELFLRIQRELFVESGYEVDTAIDGVEALKKVNRDHVAIITDIDMPNMNGIQLLKEIRGNANLKEIPILAVSSVVERKYDELINEGFDFCFDKQNNFKAIEVIDEIVG